jgi:hypothetical protein
VFVGTVFNRTSERLGGRLSWTVHQIAVNQTLRGSVDEAVTLVPGAGRPTAEQIAASSSYPSDQTLASMCDYDFELGRQYLIYARRTADGRWTTSMCMGTKPVEDASADLDYIASLPSIDATGRVYGTIERLVIDPTDRNTEVTVPASDVPVALTSDEHRLTITTNSEGRLEAQVPPGEYDVAPVVPETIHVYAVRQRVSVPSRGCAPVHFTLVANGQIEGRVAWKDGTGVPGIIIDLIPSDIPEGSPLDSNTAPSSTTDANGAFRIEPILPGRYVLGVNARYGPTLHAPYADTYFPGVGRRDALEIDISEGERKTGFTIVINPLAETTIAGKIFDGDGPAADASVTATPVTHKGRTMASATTDTTGTFRLRVLAGITYVIRATIRTGNATREVQRLMSVDQENEELRLTLGP